MKKPEAEEKKTEYIIAESDDARSFKRKEKNVPPTSSGEFIVARDNVSRKRSETTQPPTREVPGVGTSIKGWS